ncbi:MAG: nucleotide exchange factor GrpE [Desulfobacula sp.]|nr:nucleotide exchange factor GrpE [Desulfobacula sp.]
MAAEKKKKNTIKKDSPPSKAKKSKSNAASKKKDKAKELQEQLTSEKERVLRLSAEFENYKKRKQRELDDFKKFANETVFRNFLSAVDNLERAIVAAEENTDKAGLLEGVKLTHKDIIKLFETFNVKSVDAHNKEFDPNFHQAVTQEETDDFPEKTVTQVLQKGYLLHDRLLRPAMVVVSKKVKKETEETKEK